MTHVPLLLLPWEWRELFYAVFLQIRAREGLVVGTVLIKSLKCFGSKRGCFSSFRLFLAFGEFVGIGLGRWLALLVQLFLC